MYSALTRMFQFWNFLKRKVQKIGDQLSEEHLIQFDYKVILVFLVSFILFTLLVIFKIHTSSVPIWNKVVSDSQSRKLGLIFGTPRWNRWDEWHVFTPFQLSQAARGFPVENESLGVGKSPLLMITVPVSHYITLFRPQHWGFLMLDVERGFSFFWNFNVFGLFLSFFLLLMLFTRNNFWLSLVGALWVSLSNFMQWWSGGWYDGLVTSFGIICVAGVYLLFSTKKLLIVVSSAVFIMFVLNFVLLLYPPGQITLGHLCIFATVGYLVRYFQKGLFRSHKVLRSLSLVCAFAIPFVILYFFYTEVKDTIAIMTQTLYPGRRVSDGGGISITKYFSGFYTILYSESIFPTKLGANVCGASNFILLFPIVWFVLAKNLLFARKNHIITYLKHHIVEIYLSLYILLMVIWIFWGFPPIIAKLTLLERVPSLRAFLGVGIANIALIVVFLSNKDKAPLFDFRKDFSFGILVFLILIIHGFYLKSMDSFFEIWKILFVSVVFTVISYILYKKKTALFSFGILMVLLPNLLIHPVAIGLNPIFKKELAKVAKDISQTNPRAKWIVFGNSGLPQYLKALGINVFNGMKYTPDLQSMSVLDPDLHFKDIYNRFANIVFIPKDNGKEVEFTLLGTFAYVVSISPCSHKLQQLGIRYVIFAGGIPPEKQLFCLSPAATVNGDLVIWKYREHCQ